MQHSNIAKVEAIKFEQNLFYSLKRNRLVVPSIRLFANRFCLSSVRFPLYSLERLKVYSFIREYLYGIMYGR